MVTLVTYSHKPSVTFCCCSFGDMHARYDSSDFGDTCQQQLCCLPLSHVSSVAAASPLPPIQSSTSCTELPPTTPAMSHPKDQVWEFKLCLLLIFYTYRSCDNWNQDTLSCQPSPPSARTWSCWEKKADWCNSTKYCKYLLLVWWSLVGTIMCFLTTFHRTCQTARILKPHSN